MHLGYTVYAFQFVAQILDSWRQEVHWFDVLFILPKTVVFKWRCHNMYDIMMVIQALADLFLYSAEIAKVAS